jgi:hypothetical protein
MDITLISYQENSGFSVIIFDSYITDFRNIIGTNDIMDILMIENITEIIDISDTKNIMENTIIQGIADFSEIKNIMDIMDVSGIVEIKKPRYQGQPRE